jgi:hypothetical protein
MVELHLHSLIRLHGVVPRDNFRPQEVKYFNNFTLTKPESGPKQNYLGAIGPRASETAALPLNGKFYNYI